MANSEKFLGDYKYTVHFKQNRVTKQWRWVLTARNHKKVAYSGETYINKQDCINIYCDMFRLYIDPVDQKFALPNGSGNQAHRVKGLS